MEKQWYSYMSWQTNYAIASCRRNHCNYQNMVPKDMEFTTEEESH